MLAGELRGKVDGLWNAFWAGGIANPIEVIEQITYLLFLRRLDELHMAEEAKTAGLGKPVARRFFPEGKSDNHAANARCDAAAPARACQVYRQTEAQGCLHKFRG